MDNRILRRTEVLFITGLATSTLYAKMRMGEFPSPIKFGRRAVVWRARDIMNWVENLQGHAEDWFYL